MKSLGEAIQNVDGYPVTKSPTGNSASNLETPRQTQTACDRGWVGKIKKRFMLVFFEPTLLFFLLQNVSEPAQIPRKGKFLEIRL